MLKISILYPNTKGSRFDLPYYVDTHMPMSIKLLSTHPGFKGVSVERGLSGGIPGTNAAYIAMCHFLFDSVEDSWLHSSLIPQYSKVICQITQI
ncbi:EthD family reductase [Methyloglobulus sp.]|uniref:EthD family reductase n=1 Tax=Methyloglobulus sp. TaxID=2518622 RepID=UPI0032B79D73